MRRVLYFLLAIAIVAGLTFAALHLPARATLAFGDIVVETSGTMALALFLAVVVVAYLVLRVAIRLLTLPRRWRRWRAGRRRRRGDRAVVRALVALAAGDSALARHESARTRRFLGDTPQTLLLAAQAARQAGQEEEAAALFGALAGLPEASFLGLRGLFQQAVARQDWPAAATLARRAEASFPGALWLRRERLAMAVRSGAWREALALAGPEAPRAVFAAAAAATEADPAAARRLARRAWREDPRLTAAALAYAGQLRAAGSARAAQKILRAAWTANPHPDLAAFALAPLTDPMARHRAAQLLVSGRPDDPESHLLLARTALAAGLIGQARHHAEAARQHLHQRRVFLLLTEIAEQEAAAEEGAEVAAARAAAVQAALREAAAADPDPAWHCAACGAPAPAWQPVCHACGAAGRIVWESAAAAAPTTRQNLPPPLTSPPSLTSR